MKGIAAHLKFLALTSGLFAFIATNSAEKAKSSILEYLKSDTNQALIAAKNSSDPQISDNLQKNSTGLKYEKGEWEKYILMQEYESRARDLDRTSLYEMDDEVNILSYGSMNLNMKYGDSMYTSSKYKQYDDDVPTSRVIQKGFAPEHDMQLHMEGRIGRRMTVYIDHDSRKKDNHYLMQYRAVNDDEVIREINAGEIDIKFNHSKYAVYDNTTAKGLGVDITLKKDNFQIKAFGSITRGETEVERFRGNSTPGNFRLAEYQYQKRIYYQLEPFKRYDNINSTSGLPTTSAGLYALYTYTSAPPNPAAYIPYAVNIDPQNFELYLDDQNPLNKFNAITVVSPTTSQNLGLYVKMISGIDYTINFATGVITIIRAVPASARIFAVYTLNGGSTVTSDPSARTDIFTGRLFVFIKFGYNMREDPSSPWGSYPISAVTDKNNDGVCNLDIYEIRSFYQMGDRNITQDNFRLLFFREKATLDQNDVTSLGKYTVDYSRGLLIFNLREPYKKIINDSAVIDKIYTENQPDSVFEASRFSLTVDYYREARSFQLKNQNIIPDSVRVKINGTELNKSAYIVDYTTGFLMFVDKNNPLITPETDIEIKYEYIPFGASNQQFVAGVRADYKMTRDLNLGGSFLFQNSSAGNTIKQVGTEPYQTLVFEGDASLKLNEKRVSQLVNYFAYNKTQTVPVEFNAYAEYAKSYKNTNTFGKGLIDNMESNDEISIISLSEKDWQLSSPPTSFGQAARGLLNYYFYRDLSNTSVLQGESFTPTLIAYAVKPGPYNVATGHIADNIQAVKSQRSLVFDFNINNNQFVSVVTRRIASSAVDFSGLQYIEISYRFESLQSLKLGIDIGKVNEDADGDGLLGTEDLNHNGILDTDPDRGYSEDIGFAFNGNVATRIGSGPRLSSSTNGDGILNSEDLNGNGLLDTTESIFTPSDPQLTFAAGDPAWKTIQIHVNPSATEIEILKQVEAVRISIQNTSGGPSTGRLYIDGIKFVSTKWRNIDKSIGTSVLDPTVVTTLNDSTYRNESLLFAKKDLYKSLYGEKTDNDLFREKESAIQLDYNITSGYVSVTRRFAKAMDLRFYKTMNMWLNTRSLVTGDKITFTLGSSDTDTISYDFTPDVLNVWREITLKLKNGSTGSLSPSASSGQIDMKRVVFLTVRIQSLASSTGRFWLNEIYASDPDTISDDARWFETEIKIKKPLFTTKGGVPILSDLNIKYINRGHGANFSTVGKKESDISENINEIQSSVNIMPNWNTQISYTDERSKSDSLDENIQSIKRGDTNRTSFFIISDYISTKDAVPSVKISYKNDEYKNTSKESINSVISDKKTYQSIQTPSVSIIENINDFLWGKLGTKLTMNMIFKDDHVERNSTSLPNDMSEKRQRSDANLSLMYQNKIFYLQPNVTLSSEEIVEYIGKKDLTGSEILSNMYGGFHFPFTYDGSTKFVERNKGTGIAVGLKYFDLVTPEYKIDLQYFENRFRDSEFTGQSSGEFSRLKDSRSMISSQITLPVNLYKKPSLKFVKNLNVTYQRSVSFFEKDVPYEGESSGQLDEQYGLQRSVSGTSPYALNLIGYFPGFFFGGRGNFAKGRDFSNNNFNNRISYRGETPSTEYNNSLRLVENFSLSSTLDFGLLSLNTGGKLNQISERMIIYGVPQQVVTAGAFFNFNFDLMKIFSFGFFRPNIPGMPYHSANFELGFSWDTNMLITQNIEENVLSPSAGIRFKRNRTSVAFKSSIDFRQRNDHEFISSDPSKRDRADDIYILNMPQQVNFHEKSKGYSFTAIYETDVDWLNTVFSKMYKLVSPPIFYIDFSLKLNRYDYSVTVSPEPYDLYLLTSKLTLDLHKNVRGGINTRWALERFRNRETLGISREILSYEFGMNFSLIF